MEEEIEWVLHTEDDDEEENWFEKENEKYICANCGWSAYPTEEKLRNVIGLPHKYCDNCSNKLENKLRIMTNLSRETKYIKCERCYNRKVCYEVPFLAGHICE